MGLYQSILVHLGLFIINYIKQRTINTYIWSLETQCLKTEVCYMAQHLQ